MCSGPTRGGSGDAHPAGSRIPGKRRPPDVPCQNPGAAKLAGPSLASTLPSPAGEIPVGTCAVRPGLRGEASQSCSESSAPRPGASVSGNRSVLSAALFQKCSRGITITRSPNPHRCPVLGWTASPGSCKRRSFFPQVMATAGSGFPTAPLSWGI